MNVLAIVQARMGSSRFPGKVMQSIFDVPMIEVLLRRLSLSEHVKKIVVATSVNAENQALSRHVRNIGFDVFEGSENNVLDRFYQSAKEYKADIVVRITGDCPLVDAELLDDMLLKFQENNYDYFSNTNPPSFPDGLDIEIMTFDALEKTWVNADQDFDKEHVTPFLRTSGEFLIGNYQENEDCSEERWTVDTVEDLEVIRNVFDYFAPCRDFSWREVLKLSKSQPDLFLINKHLERNQGANMSSGQKLWQRAKNVIPGGNMLLSKRAEMFAPEQWPAYFSKAKGCRVWDLDGHELIDMSIMGVGTNTLGYGHQAIDKTVSQVISNGNMSSLNCPEEVYLAERLVELHPWADMARFARSGGEANAIAVRIARVASGKDKVAICGYHGWHDWYLSANLGNDKNLDGHLLPGLDPAGVPRELQGSVLPFNYNNFSELENLVKTHDIGVIKMEVQRNESPDKDYLNRVRDLATDNNIVLIFDECTSGFRETFGGLHKKYGVEPDIAIFGKTLGNGYAITAIIGRREVMEAAQSSFISSTFWTERIGPCAALKTLDVMEELQSWEYITDIGAHIKRGWQQLADQHQLKIQLWGLDALAGFSFESPNNAVYKTFITQEMLTKGYLATNCVYTCIDHSTELVEEYLKSLESIFTEIKKCESGGDPLALLTGPVCHSGFKRLN